MVAFAFPVLAIALILYRLGKSSARQSGRRTEGKPLRRAVAMVALRRGGRRAGLGLVARPRALPSDAALRGRHAPAGRGARRCSAPASPVAASAAAGGGAGPQGAAGRPPAAHARTSPCRPWSWSRRHRDRGQQRCGGRARRRGHRRRPRPRSGERGGPTGTVDPQAPTWVFPFDQPLPPDEGDTQALAVNTTDRTVQYDVAMAMVWVEDDQVLNTNEAYAFELLGLRDGGDRVPGRDHRRARPT